MAFWKALSVYTIENKKEEVTNSAKNFSQHYSNYHHKKSADRNRKALFEF
jgi:hypothetical protein